MPELRAVPDPQPDAEAARRHLALLGHPVYFLRVLGGRETSGRRIWPTEGYFDSPESAAAAAVALSRQGAHAVYAGLQRVDPECLHRSVNAFGAARDVAAVSDRDVTHYRHLLVDLDPQRPKGVSATAEEMAEALRRADAAAAFLADLEWPDPLYVMGSGNGAHVVYRVRLPATRESAGLVKRALATLAQRFSDARVEVDVSVHNPSRITKLAGTWVRKGDATRERPHRVAWIERAHERAAAVKVGQLRALADSLAPRRAGELRRAPEGTALADLAARMEERGLLPQPKEWRGTTLVACRCWRADHEGRRTAFVVLREPTPGRGAGEGEPRAGGAGALPPLLARCLAAHCDADAANLLAHLGLEEAPAPADADAARAVVAAVNATGLAEVWEGGTLTYVVTSAELGERVVRTPAAARTLCDPLPRLRLDDGTDLHAFAAWSRSAEKRRAWGSVWDPAAPFGAVVGEGAAARLNRWQGFAYAPERTARGARLADAWRANLRENLCGGRRELDAYLWRLCAWKVQHPTHLPFVLLVLTGEQGSGKGTFARALVNLFGAHGLHSQSALSKFNTQHEGRALVYHDEAEFLAAPQIMRLLKALATEQELTREDKYVLRYQGRNLAWHVLASNDPRVHVEAGDRRILLLETRAPAEGARWFQRRGLDGVVGPDDLERPASRDLHRELLRRLLAARIPKGWRPFPPPRTAERLRAIAEGLPPLDAWVYRAVQQARLPGLPERAWGAEGAALGPEDRERAWAAFRAELGARGGASAERAAGAHSLDAFSRRLRALLGATPHATRRGGRSVRVWDVPGPQEARAACEEALGGRAGG